MHESGTPLKDIPAFEPLPGTHEKTDIRVLYVNGIITDTGGQATAAQALANETGASVTCLHNATSGFMADINQTVLDKMGLAENRAVTSIASYMKEAARSGEPLNIVSHSHGDIETSRAYRAAARDLIGEGYSAQQVRESLHDNIHAVSVGGAAATYPPFANTHALINVQDTVPMAFGRGYQDLRVAAEQLNPGSSAQHMSDVLTKLSAERPTCTWFQVKHGDQGDNHSFEQVYVKYVDERWFVKERHRGLREQQKP
jgi:hypothetical protein